MVQLVVRCTVLFAAIGDVFEEITCSSPELVGDTPIAVAGTAATVTVLAAATPAVDVVDIFRR